MRALVLSVCIVFFLAAAPPAAFSLNGMVASDHQVASKVGADILASGGNAVDALIATTLAAGVVQPAGSGLGGGGFAMIRDSSGAVHSIDFREIAPKAATEDMFIKSSDASASRFGGLAVATPGEAQGLIALHRQFGSLPLKKLVNPAIDLAHKGFRVGPQLHKSFLKMDDKGIQMAERLGLKGVPSRQQLITRRRLAKTLKAFQCSDGKTFQDGWVAKDIVKSVNNAGGILTLADLAENKPRQRDPLSGSYRGWTVHSMGPPSSGGLTLLQILSALESRDLRSMGHNSSQLLHLYAETFQHAFADRANYMGDPDRVVVPTEKLLSPERIQSVRESFNPNQTLGAEAYGAKLDIGQDSGTQHISVIDDSGMMASLTSTINTIFGSRVVATQSGVLLNNEMDDFVARPGVPNHYGLIGSSANSVAPGAVPLSSMSPTLLISPDGEQKMAIGASGGPFIITSTLQAIINVIDFEMDPSSAVAAPRIHHQWAPRKLFLDDGIPKDVQAALQDKGHDVKTMSFYSSVQVVIKNNSEFSGASDPRKGGWPSGFSKR